MSGVGLTREQAAERRIQAALDHLQQAQNHAARACAALSSLLNVMPESQATIKVYETTKATWYRLNDKAEKLRKKKALLLDKEPNEYEREWGRLPIDPDPCAAGHLLPAFCDKDGARVCGRCGEPTECAGCSQCRPTEADLARERDRARS